MESTWWEGEERGILQSVRVDGSGLH